MTSPTRSERDQNELNYENFFDIVTNKCTVKVEKTVSTAVDPLFGLIQASSSIKIKRSDGRIYLAKVVQLSSESKFVGVEWNEHGEVEGKEILLDLVFGLNNELRLNATFQQPASVINQQTRPIAAVPILANCLSSSRLTLDILIH
ncbi:unnamed protein product [Rotaria socialis]|uniref:Kinesin-like protein KIF2A-like N-terminal domain-containing protein n=1 Tax=Rotaria socialis TaxID=392032 RepID=A0A821A3F4_9BILA|nr:unnamed protein product [Rotaria socialis]CAF4571259.1 unnamed protein product [Rotaria socialis]